MPLTASENLRISQLLESLSSSEPEKNLYSLKESVIWLCGFVKSQESLIDDLKSTLNDIKSEHEDELRHATGND